MYALEVHHLSKSFDSVKAVDDISFIIPEGSVFGLIGRNGAGKTTTIRMMMNIYLPDSGEVILRGSQIGQEFKDKVGYLPEERGLYKKMKVLETLLFFAELKGKTGKEVEKKAVYYLNKFELASRKNSKLEDLSKGNQQKIQFITTILHDPEFIILDEPFSGLDPINTDLLMQIILDLKSQKKVIILSTHLMEFAEKMCDHIAMIDEGKIILKGNLDEIKKSFGQKNVTISHVGDISFLKNYPFIDTFESYGNVSSVRVKDPLNVQDLLRTLVDKKITIKKFDAEDISLHQIFVEVAGKNSGERRGMEVPNVQ
jgi:ABC-2 type transport system ATP-binding protein